MTRREELDFIDQRFSADSDVNPQVVFGITAEDWALKRNKVLSSV
jgi:hypothetical protein